MKKTDIAMIILIIAVSVIVSYVVVGAIPGLQDANKPVRVKTTEQYNSSVGELDSTVFNKDAINPTVQVTIGANNGQSQ